MTLIEIMVALVVSLVLLGGVFQIFLGSRHTYNVQQGLSRIQENGRFIAHEVGSTLRTAGFMGCGGGFGEVHNMLNNPDHTEWDFQGEGIFGYEAVNTNDGDTVTLPTGVYTASGSASLWSAARASGTVNLADTLVDKVVAGNDVVVVRSASGGGLRVASNAGGATFFIQNDGSGTPACPGGLCVGDVLLLSNCQLSVAFQATGIGTTGPGGIELRVTHSGDNTLTPGNAYPSWGGAGGGFTESDFGPESFVFKVSTKFYYIGVGKNGRPALYFREGVADPEELIDNVENMQIVYGEDTNGDLSVDVYRTAAEVNDWDKVLSARVSVLLAGDIGSDPEATAQDFELAGVTVEAPADRRLRKTVSFTVTLRNQFQIN